MINPDLHRIYTNDIERERLRQAAYATTQHEISLNLHRIRRAGERQLFTIALVALQTGDMLVYDAAIAATGIERGGDELTPYCEVIESRRDSHAVRYGFASNRMLDIAVLDQAPATRFPMVDEPALHAAKGTRLVAHA